MLSKYRAESEVLFPPCTMLIMLTRDGIVARHEELTVGAVCTTSRVDPDQKLPENVESAGDGESPTPQTSPSVRHIVVRPSF
eukprot:SAG11_NODE_38478_length_252_cov_0.673203_1_plen_81_part_01